MTKDAYLKTIINKAKVARLATADLEYKPHLVPVGGKKLEQNEMQLLEKAHKLLCNKYPQYQKIGVGEYLIMIMPHKVIAWKNNGWMDEWMDD